MLRRTVRAIHSVSRFVEHTVTRDVVRDDPGWQPILERIDDIVPPPPDPTHGASFERSEWGLLGRLPPVPYILFVGALQAHKGLDVLLDAWGRLGDMPAGAVGRPPLVLIGTRSVDTPASFPAGVTVLSDVPHRVVMAAWERCRFGVVPSRWPDPLPGVVREPMTRGKAVIGSDVGGIPDMITDETNGLLVPAGDAAALAVAMSRLVADPAMCDRLGKAGRRSVADLTPAAIGHRFVALYERVLDDVGGTHR